MVAFFCFYQYRSAPLSVMLNGSEASHNRKREEILRFTQKQLLAPLILRIRQSEAEPMTSLRMIKEDRAESARRLQIPYNVHALDLYIKRIRDMLV